MQRQEIRSLVRNSLPRYDKGGMWHDYFLNGAIEKALAQMYEDVWRMNPLNLQRYTIGYGYTTALPVLSEAATSIRYVTLPQSIIPFQDKASGVRRVSTPTQGALKFIPMDQREMELVANGSYFATMNSAKQTTGTNIIGYVVNQTLGADGVVSGRVEFYGMTDAVAALGVRMDLIIPFSKFAEEDEVKIPEIADMRTGETFMDRVMKIVGVVQPTDVKDDNTDRHISQKDN